MYQNIFLQQTKIVTKNNQLNYELSHRSLNINRIYTGLLKNSRYLIGSSSSQHNMYIMMLMLGYGYLELNSKKALEDEGKEDQNAGKRSSKKNEDSEENKKGKDKKNETPSGEESDDEESSDDEDDENKGGGLLIPVIKWIGEIFKKPQPT